MRKKTNINAPPPAEDLERQMARGIRAESMPLYTACAGKLRARGLWDAISMRAVRDACVLNDAANEYRTDCARRLREGAPKLAAVLLRMQRDAIEERDAILSRWDLVPAKKRGRPAEETPEDLKAEEQDDGWDSFGAEDD